MIRVVSFDGDDTLWHFQPVLLGALERCLAQLRAEVPGAAALEVADLLETRAAVEPSDGPPDLTELRVLGFLETLRRVGREGDRVLAERLTETFLEHRSSLIDPYPEVLATLDALAERYTVGLISNGNADTERCILRGRFAFRVHAHDHGVSKPDAELYRVALRQAGCDPAEMVHVGDSLAFDVAGAQAAGIAAVWLNRERQEAPAHAPVPEGEIATLDELPALLDRLEARRG